RPQTESVWQSLGTQVRPGTQPTPQGPRIGPGAPRVPLQPLHPAWTTPLPGVAGPDASAAAFGSRWLAGAASGGGVWAAAGKNNQVAAERITPAPQHQKRPPCFAFTTGFALIPVLQ